MLSLGVAAGLACNSDDRFELGLPDLTTGEGTTVIYEFTTGEPDDTTSTGEVPIPKDSCRDGITCVLGCAVMLDPMDPQQDYSCFTGCLDLLTTEELYKLVKLVECIGNYCSNTDPPACSSEPDGDNSGCQVCLTESLLGIFDDKAVLGCEAPSMTCT
ncbi:MAG: hypothetical protein H0T76_07145 [Nannocystis sp.]|nr:hypothetical protein [Nannocystis sp.]MBA3546239.1 hypothetical protein [Nannocystis sp.]